MSSVNFKWNTLIRISSQLCKRKRHHQIRFACCHSQYSGVHFCNGIRQQAEQPPRNDDPNWFDVVVVGGGHAGCEASHAASRMGARTLLITHKKTTIGAMSCNPSFGGIGKGHLLREIDALDGLCSRICDKAGIHYKMLNRSKGPAVWGPRAQIDRGLYRDHLQEELFSMQGLHIREAAVEDLLVDHTHDGDKVVRGVVLADGSIVNCNSVIITAGTFLRGETHLGLDVRPAGRLGDAPAVGLANTLNSLGFRVARLKTGTPPRLVRSSIDYSTCGVQHPDYPPTPFSYMHDTVNIQASEQVVCHMTHTPVSIEEVIRESLHLNHHVKEEVVGPRYCPSIESKIIRFPGRSHQVWLEPEGLESDLVYPQGLNCTMPVDYQLKMLRLVPALHNVEIAQPGYGVEYDYLEPRDLYRTLESRLVTRLYLAGQVNGTTGYEEAAAQGLVAGVNAACEPGKELSIDRTEGYIGVMLDDLTTHGAMEPYRMFTSRAEYRLFLRPDNADTRLTDKGYQSGCVSDVRYARCSDQQQRLQEALALLQSDVRSGYKWIKILGLQHATSRDNRDACSVLGVQHWGVTIQRLAAIDPAYEDIAKDAALCERIKVEAIYQRPVQQQMMEIMQVRKEEAMVLPKDMDYYSPEISLSNEMRSKLSEARPDTLAAASRLRGIVPSAVLNIMRHLKKIERQQQYKKDKMN